MTRNATAKASGGPAQAPTPLWPLLTLALGALTACSQPPSGAAAKRPDPAAVSVAAAAKGQQPVGYDVQGLERRLVTLLVKLNSFDDVQPQAVAKAFDLKLRPRAIQPLSMEGVGRLSNGWVFNVWAWQSAPSASPQAPLQLYFYPGGEIDPNLWVDAPCFLDTAGMLSELKAAGYAMTGERSVFPLHSIELSRTTPRAEFTVSVGDYRMLHGPQEGKWCLRKLAVSAQPASLQR